MNKRYFLFFSMLTLTAGLTEFTRCASEKLDAPSEQEQAIDQAVIDRAHEYISARNIRELTAILERHPDIVNIQNGFRKTLLHSAVFFGKGDIAKILIDKGVNVNTADWLGQTALHLATEAAIFRLLLDNGAHVDATTPTGATALHMAVSSDQADGVKLLLARGADVNATVVHAVDVKETALSCSVNNKNTKITRLLLSHFPFINLTEEEELDLPPNWKEDRAAAFTTVRELLARENFPNAVVDSIVIPMVGKEYLLAAQTVVAQEALIAPEETAGMQEDAPQAVVAAQEQAAVVQGAVRVVPVQEIIIDIQGETAEMQEDVAVHGPRRGSQKEDNTSCCLIL